MRNTFVATLTELAAKNRDIWLLCGDLGFSVLEEFASSFPDRYVNVGVAEQNMAGVAAGIALSGKTVFIYSIGNFPTLRCLEQIRNDVCYHRADVKVVSVGGGFAYGSQGYTHHAIEDVAIMSTLPGMQVFVPCDPSEVKAVTRLLSRNRRPSYLRLSRSGEPDLGAESLDETMAPRPLRAGSDGVILASGPIAAACLAAADLLADRISIGVVSVPRLKPFDEAIIRDLTRSSRIIVTVEEHILRGGLGSVVAGILAATGTHPPLLTLGVPEEVGKNCVAGDRDALLARAGLSPKALADRVAASFAAL